MTYMKSGLTQITQSTFLYFTLITEGGKVRTLSIGCY